MLNISIRAFALKAGVGKGTVVLMEATGEGRVSTIARMEDKLGMKDGELFCMMKETLKKLSDKI